MMMLLANTSAVLTFAAASGLAIIEHIQAIDPAQLSGWEGISFKLFLILALGLSMLINIVLAKWVATQLIPVLKEISVASAHLKDGIHHLSNATKRCLKNQGIDLEAAD